MPWFRPFSFIKIVAAFFEIFQKKEGKKTLFSSTITILDHPLYGKVKRESLFFRRLTFWEEGFKKINISPFDRFVRNFEYYPIRSYENLNLF